VTAPDGRPPALEVRDLAAGYGGIPVISGVSFSLPKGSFGAILGSNGAGKTTTLRAIMGLAQIFSGTVELGGEATTDMDPHEVVACGMALSPEGRRVFSGLTVEENLRTGALVGAGRREQAGRFEQVFSYFPRLRERLSQTAGTLSGGEQQMLAIGRALMSGPSVLLIDEGSLGLAPVMVETVFDLVSRINADGVTVLAVEQNVAVIDHADLVFVLEKGSIDFGGPVAEVGHRLRAEVLSAYLGQEGG
jgi:branched-chain amino acid transport system ATP-binding protein